MGVPHCNGWLVRENRIKIDDLGVPLWLRKPPFVDISGSMLVEATVRPWNNCSGGGCNCNGEMWRQHRRLRIWAFWARGIETFPAWIRGVRTDSNRSEQIRANEELEPILRQNLWITFGILWLSPSSWQPKIASKKPSSAAGPPACDCDDSWSYRDLNHWICSRYWKNHWTNRNVQSSLSSLSCIDIPTMFGIVTRMFHKSLQHL